MPKQDDVDLKSLFEHTNILKEGDIEKLNAVVEAETKKKRKRDKRDKKDGLEIGPFIESKCTYAIELLFKHILSGDDVEISVTENPQGYKAFVHKDGTTREFNLSEWLKHANLSHIDISNADEVMYERYAQNLCEQPRRIDSHQRREENLSSFPDKEYFTERDKNKKLEALTYAEKLAINAYTGNFYVDINSLLRGEILFVPERWGSLEEYGAPVKTKQKRVKDALVTSIMAVSGLNKITDEYIPAVFRVEKSAQCPSGLLEERKQKAEGGEAGSVTLERGFMSAAVSRLDKTLNIAKKSDINTVFVGLIGKYIGPLTQMMGYQAEFLIPPTQVSWVGYQKVGDQYYFLARPVRTLTNLAREASEAPPIGKELKVDDLETSFGIKVKPTVLSPKKTLFNAIESNDVKAFEEMIGHANLDLTELDWDFLLYRMVGEGKPLEFTKLLLEKNANPNTVIDRGYGPSTAIWEAIKSDNRNLLVLYRASGKVTHETCKALALECIHRGGPIELKTLIEAFNLDLTTGLGAELLDKAGTTCHFDFVELLLEKNVNPNIRLKDKDREYTVVENAIIGGNELLLEIYKKSGKVTRETWEAAIQAPYDNNKASKASQDSYKKALAFAKDAQLKAELKEAAAVAAPAAEQVQPVVAPPPAAAFVQPVQPPAPIQAVSLAGQAQQPAVLPQVAQVPAWQERLRAITEAREAREAREREEKVRAEAEAAEARQQEARVKAAQADAAQLKVQQPVIIHAKPNDMPNLDPTKPDIVIGPKLE